jgi:hypothetical protein
MRDRSLNLDVKGEGRGKGKKCGVRRSHPPRPVGHPSWEGNLLATSHYSLSTIPYLITRLTRIAIDGYETLLWIVEGFEDTASESRTGLGAGLLVDDDRLRIDDDRVWGEITGIRCGMTIIVACRMGKEIVTYADFGCYIRCDVIG